MLPCCGKPKTEEFLPELACPHFFDYHIQRQILAPGVHQVGIVYMNQQEYVIGLVERVVGEGNKLCPFFVPANGHLNQVDRIKIRVNEHFQKADVYEPIGTTEKTLNDLFFNDYPPILKATGQPNPHFKVRPFKILKNPSKLESALDVDNTAQMIRAHIPLTLRK